MSDGDFEDYGERRLRRAVDDLAAEFHGVWSRETIDRFVHECHAQLCAQAGPGLNFGGLHAGRFARERLWALAQAEGKVAKVKPEALFVCVRNAGRSQMAAALTHHLSAGAVGVRSAGSAPSDAIHPLVVSAMQEIEIDVHEEFPKPLTDDVVRAADVVITMGCGDACPVYPGKRYEDWEVADPDGQTIEAVRTIRDDIAARVRALIADLSPIVRSRHAETERRSAPASGALRLVSG